MLFVTSSKCFWHPCFAREDTSKTPQDSTHLAACQSKVLGTLPKLISQASFHRCKRQSWATFQIEQSVMWNRIVVSATARMTVAYFNANVIRVSHHAQNTFHNFFTLIVLYKVHLFISFKYSTSNIPMQFIPIHEHTLFTFSIGTETFLLPIKNTFLQAENC